MKKVFLILLFCFLACGKDGRFEMETPQERVENQTEMLNRLKGRLQVSKVSLYDKYFSVQFSSGEVFEFSNEGTPIFSSSNKGTWVVNGNDTKVTVNSLALPEVGISGGSTWVINGTDTGVAVFEKLRPEDVAKSTISHVFFINNYFIVLLKDGTSLKAPVVEDSFYYVPDYFLDPLIKQEKRAENLIDSSGGESYSFVFFSDTHWGRNTKKSPAIIHHITDYTSIQDVYFGGDVITTYYTEKEKALSLGAEFQSTFSFLGPNFFCIYGNHDNNSDSQPSKTDYHLSDEQVFSWLQNQMTEVYLGDYFNFYYDIPESKTRVIGLDTGRCYYSVFRDKLHLTVQFALDALSSLPSGWHSVIASHIWCEAKKESDGTYNQYLASYIKPILTVFDNYNNRKGGKYTYNNQTILYDFSDAGGRIEFCIGGHTHAAYETRSEGGIPVVIVNSDSVKQPEKGTIREQSVTLTVANYKTRKLHLLVVGRGEDRIIDL